jgi:hypothetical protein
MLSTLKEALMSIKAMKPEQNPKANISDGLLGKYEGIIPEGKTSTEYIREQRAAGYGKVEK